MESSLQRPYEVVKNKDWDYSFQTKHGIIYHAYFIEFSNYHPAFSDVYTFPRSHVLLDAFYDLVKNDFYPID